LTTTAFTASTPPFVGHADDGDVGDGRMAEQGALDLGGIDVLAADTIMSFTRS